MWRQQAWKIRQGIRLISRMSGGGEPQSKKAHVEGSIGTHNGTFHCDEVLACFLLRQLPRYKDSKIVRTRDPAVLDTCDIVVDVGGTYDHSKARYDHHQRTFTDNMNSLNPDKKWVTKLSSAGLVYLHYGQEIIANLLNADAKDSITNVIYDKVYENFVEEIDAIDNGISQSDEKPRYAMSTNLSSRVGHLNPRWNQADVDIDIRFHKAMAMVGAEFLDRVSFYSESWWPARQVVKTAIESRRDIDESGEIIVLKNGGCPWKDHLFAIEEELNISPPIKYVLYTDQSEKWRIQCVPVYLGTFENRLSLPEEWQGVRDEELSQKSGIAGCIFVHANGFIGGNQTYEGILQMAKISIAKK